MKKIIFSIVALIALSISFTTAQTVKTVELEQTEGAFTITELTIPEGTYVFEISNSGIDHEVGFVLAPKGMPEAEHHIKAAYVQSAVKKGETQSSKEVKLTKGEYIYFCPLNPTPQYKLTVK